MLFSELFKREGGSLKRGLVGLLIGVTLKGIQTSLAIAGEVGDCFSLLASPHQINI